MTAGEACQITKEAFGWQRSAGIEDTEQEAMFRASLCSRLERRIQAAAESGSFDTKLFFDTDIETDDPLPEWLVNRVNYVADEFRKRGFKVYPVYTPRHPYGSYERFHQYTLQIGWGDY